MRTRVAIAAVVALSVFGQPVAAGVCAVKCHSHETSQMPTEHQCGLESARELTLATLTPGVVFCDHTTTVASPTIERHEVVRPAQAHTPWVTAAPALLEQALVGAIFEDHGPPGSIPVPLPLRI